jgi:uncharacterized membrane protein YfcA
MITDPWFYAIAVPAVLLMGLSKSGFLGGFGALATPLMALAVPVPQAAAIMLPLLLLPLALLGVWAGVWALRRVDPTWFYRLAYAGMFVTGVELLRASLR